MRYVRAERPSPVWDNGIVKTIFAPKSGLFSARNSPSCASMIERETAKPIPMPFSFVVTKASKVWVMGKRIAEKMTACPAIGWGAPLLRLYFRGRSVIFVAN